ncbi:hypothetical protein D3C71_1189010 [compost metagenome]
MQHVRLDSQFRQLLRRRIEQALGVFYHSSHIQRNAAGEERDIVVPFVYGNFSVRVELGGIHNSGGSCMGATYNNDFHDFFLLQNGYFNVYVIYFTLYGHYIVIYITFQPFCTRVNPIFTILNFK